MFHIFLIRHGESIANTGENDVERLPDHLVSLTDNGIQQAFEAGQWLRNYCDDKKIDLSHARIWRSPYKKTRQTSEEFNKFLCIPDIREDITLVEQRFGLFDCVPEEKWEELFPFHVNMQSTCDKKIIKGNSMQGFLWASLRMM